MTARRTAGLALVAPLVLFAAPFAGVAAAATATPPGTDAVYCSGSTATAFTGCYVDGASSPLSVPAGSTITTDPVVPPTATSASGLISPDGILGVIPATDVPSGLGIPTGATTILYIDKQVGYFIPGTTTTALTLPISTPTNIVVTGDYSGFGAGTYYVASNSDVSSGPSSLSCTGAVFSAGNTTLQNCTSTNTDSIPKGSDVGAPGSCITPGSVLQEIGEGSTKGKTLFKNNEDYAAVRMAYTTDGTHFTDVTPAAGITGLASPTAQTGFRWISPGGSLIQNPDGSLGLFYSEGQCTDGDSDAFGSIEYSYSTDGGLTWSAGTQIPDGDTTYGTGYLSTDYTFSASLADEGTTNPLDVSAYYEGRIYSPSVVWNSGNTSLTMVFAGYRTSKPLPATGSGALAIGRASETSLSPAAHQWTPQATDAALYRNILTVQLTQVPGSNPAAYTAGTPAVAEVTGGPWTTAQGDPGSGGTEAPYSPNGGSSGGTFTPGGSPTNMFASTGSTAFPNLATYPGSGTTGTAIPYTTGYSGTPGPLAGYCGTGGTGGTGLPAREPAGVYEPMSPYYFPHIERNADGTLTGYFDYRPKDTDEALVVATSSDNGAHWSFQTEALELSQGHCPNGNSDVVAQTTTDDGEGHAFDLTVNGTTYLYTLNRSSGTLDTVGSEFLVHTLDTSAASLGLPASEPVGTGSSTTSTGSNTITNTPGGVSTSSFTVTSTAGFQEIPGRIYVMPLGEALPESPLTVLLPAMGAGIAATFVVIRRRKRSVGVTV
jgi:hypothetical protein